MAIKHKKKKSAKHCFRCLEFRGEKVQAAFKVRYVWLAKYGTVFSGRYPTPFASVCAECVKVYDDYPNAELRAL